MTWERFKIILRKCPNHGFEDIAQLSIFLNAATGGTMMTLDGEQATRIIDALASTDSQAQYDERSIQKKGWLEDALLGQNKMLTQ